MAARWEPRGPIGRFVNSLEETAIAALLGGMVIFTFVNVILRKLSGWSWLRAQEAAYGFDVPDSILWSLEFVLILFAWLVILGVSYGFKITAHLGVDALTNALPGRAQRVCAILAGAVCVAYALLLLKGAWDFWAPFGNFAPFEGRVIPEGFREMRPHHFQGYTPTDQVPFPGFMRAPLEAWLLLEGDEPFEKLPRAIPYLILPFGVALTLLRIGQATAAVIRGRQASLIVSHEAEGAVEDAAADLDRSEAGAEAAAVYGGVAPPAAKGAR